MIIYFHICRISRTLLSPISGVFLHYNIFHKESCSFSPTYVKARKNFSLAFYYSSSASTIKFGSNSSNSSSAIWKSSSDSTHLQDLHLHKFSFLQLLLLQIHVLQLQQFYYHLVIQVLLNNLAAE